MSNTIPLVIISLSLLVVICVIFNIRIKLGETRKCIIKMKSNDELKEIDLKNCTRYYFDDN